MPDETQEILQTPAPDDTALFADETAVLHAADAWQVKGFSVADAVRAQTTFGARVAELEESQAAAKAYWEANQIPFLDITKHKPEASAIAVVPAETARLHGVLPIRKVDNKLWVAMKNPLDIQAVDAVRMASRCQVLPMACVPEGTLDYELALAYPQPEPAPVETRANENATAELIALVRDLQNAVRELTQEVQGLKKRVAAQQIAPPIPDARPAAYPAPSAFQRRPAAQQPPFPLFRD